MQKRSLNGEWFTVGIIFLFIGTFITPCIHGNIFEKENTVFQIKRTRQAGDTINDWIQDVYSINQSGNITLITNSTDIEVDNIDVQQVTFSQQGEQVNLTLQVVGKIENRGSFDNESLPDEIVMYSMQVSTSEQDYIVQYCNQTCLLQFGLESINLTSSHFKVVNDTFSVGFSLLSPNETYKHLYAISDYTKLNFSEKQLKIVYLYDIVPNILAKVACIGFIHDMTLTHDYILFNPMVMTSIMLGPFQVYPLTKGPMPVSITYHGCVGRWFVMGLFEVDLSIFWPAQDSCYLSSYFPDYVFIGKQYHKLLIKEGSV